VAAAVRNMPNADRQTNIGTDFDRKTLLNMVFLQSL
jgi:hypothetical protein